MYRPSRNDYHYDYYREEMPFVSQRSINDSPNDVVSDARVLFDAVRHGKTHLVRFILEAAQGDIIHCRDLHGKTPLMACCYTKEEGARDKVVKLLLRHGVDVNATDDFGRTVLSYVCEKRCNDILRILVKEHNIDPDIPDLNGNTPLTYSAMVGNDIGCDNLIRHFRRLGLNVDVVNADGFTPLLLAAKNGNITCAQILMGQGKASPSVRDRKYGLSLEEWLSKRGFSLKDIAPVRNDGRGRSRFVKVANIAAMCTGPRKVAPADNYRYQTYAQEGVRLERFDDANEDDYHSDATTGTSVSTAECRYIERRYSDTSMLNRRETPKKLLHQSSTNRRPSKPKMKTMETQTMPILIDCGHDDEELDGATVADTEVTILKENVHLAKKKHKKSDLRHAMMTRSASKRSFTVPENSRNEQEGSRKMSLDAGVLPEKLIATIDLGDGRRQSIQIHPDSFKNKVYWTPFPDDDGAETVNTLLFDPLQKSDDSDSQCSTNDEAVFG